MRRQVFASAVSRRGGWSIVDVVISVGCILLLAAIGLPWLLTVRGVSREKTCLDRMRDIGQAVISYSENSNKNLPYLENDFPWTVSVTPYLDFPAAVRDGKIVPESELETLQVPMWMCPDDPRSSEKLGAMSYVINAGYGLFSVDEETGAVSETGTHSAEIDLDGDGKVSDSEWAINYATGVCWRPDTREGNARFRMAMPFITSRDGTSYTLLLTENLNAGNWLSRKTMDTSFVIGREQLKFAEGEDSHGPLHLLPSDFGPFRINAKKGTLPGQCPAPSSFHGHDVHVIYCDGSGGPMSEHIDPLAFSGVMTPNGSSYGQGSGQAAIPLGPVK